MVSVATTKGRIRRTSRYLIGHVREISPTGWERKLMLALKGKLIFQSKIPLAIKEVFARIIREKLPENDLTIIDIDR